MRTIGLTSIRTKIARGASLPSGLPSAVALPRCWDSTTAPVRRFFQDVNYGSTEVSRAVEEARLNQRRVALERQSANLVREYVTYNADVSAHIRCQNSGASLLCGSVQAQIPCLTRATQPVRNFFQDVNYGASEMQRATEEVRLNQRRVELQRRASELSQEYAAYNADVTSFLHYNYARRPNTSLYLPQPAGWTDPNGTGLWTPDNSEPWPNPASVQSDGRSTPAQNYSPANVTPAQQLPASQPGNFNPNAGVNPNHSYVPVQQQVYPPVPTQVLPSPQPNGNYQPVSREHSLLYNDGMGNWNAPGYIPAYTASQPGPAYRF